MQETDSPIHTVGQISGLQVATILVCFLMNVLDGLDVLVISYCAPAIAEEWSISPEALGAVFSAGLAGMTLGALLLAPLADSIGRKSMIFWSALLMGGSIFITAFAPNITALVLLRFLSGLGIGSMLASTAALASEYTPERSRDFWVSFVISGYPVGAVLAGLVAAKVVPQHGWQIMFKGAGLASLVTLPLVVFFLSESLEFMFKRQPAHALRRANGILVRLGRPQLSELPQRPPVKKGIPAARLLESEYRWPTVQLWAALFLAFCSLYFLISWIPKLAANSNLSMELAIYAGTVFNGGAFIGVLTQGFFSARFGLKRTIGCFLVATAALMVLFRFFVDSNGILLILGILGFGIQGGFVGLYAVAARMYPTEFRTTGVGWSIGIGRLGGVIGPALGGILIGLGLSMVGSFLIFSIPTFLAGLVTFRLTSKNIS